MGTLRLTLQGNQVTTNIVTPTVRVNGYPVRVQYGQQDIAVYAGPTRVDIATEWTRTYGQASTEVVVGPGEVVPLFYAQPWHVFSRGSIGHEKQRRRGLGQMVGILTGIVALVVVLIGGVAVLATLG